MISGQSTLLTQAQLELLEKQIKSLFIKKNDAGILIDFEQVRKITDIALQLGKACKLAPEELEFLQISALFMHSGITQNNADYRQNSKRLAAKILTGIQYPEPKLDRVQKYIDSTLKGSIPKDEIERVLTDAKNWHLADGAYIKRLKAKNIRQQELRGKVISDKNWFQKNQDLLKKHQYYTQPAKDLFSQGILKNIEQLNKKIRKIEKSQDLHLQKDLEIDAEELKALKKKLKKVSNRPERGVETMFRLASRNHFTLNTMVDTKSSILISVNSIILSIIIGTVMKQFNEDPHLIVPVIILSITNLWSITLAVFATRPELSHGKPDGKSNQSNLLFYGNFHQMQEQDYLRGMNEMMNDGEILYNSLSKDIYHLGVNLNKKFRLLRRSFTVFIYGFMISVLTFIVCHLFFGGMFL